MPELPEVKNVVKNLHSYVVGKQVIDILVFLPKLIKNTDVRTFKTKLKNKQIQDVYNVGKFIVFKFDHDLYVVNHLRMEGNWRWKTPTKNKHNHLTFILTGDLPLIYNDSRQFGTFHLFEEDPINLQPLQKLGKTPDKISSDWLYQKLQNKKIAIKTALLDQTIILGLGNIYVNEVLYAAQIHPLTASFNITADQVKIIVKVASKILQKATDLGGTTINTFAATNDKTGSYQDYLLVHGKVNTPCGRCQNQIAKMKVNGRGTYYCPACQKLP